MELVPRTGPRGGDDGVDLHTERVEALGKGWEAACLAGTALTRSAVTAKTARASATSAKTDRRRRLSASRWPCVSSALTATATVDASPGIG